MAAHSSSSTSKCTRRKNTDVQDKLQIIDELKLGKSIPDICTEYGISQSQVYRIYQGRDSLTKNVLKGNIPVHSKQGQIPNYS